MSKQKLEPCPFCGEAIKHIGSWARSFDPPRLYHEWHHPAVQCYLNPHGGETQLFCSSDDPKEQTLRLDAWNTRARCSADSAKPPRTEQGCYDLGYNNPAKSSRDFTWQHVVDVNAYRCGQLDRQNQQPRNPNYQREDYDPGSFERKPPPVTFDEPPVASDWPDNSYVYRFEYADGSAFEVLEDGRAFIVYKDGRREEKRGKIDSRIRLLVGRAVKPLHDLLRANGITGTEPQAARPDIDVTSVRDVAISECVKLITELTIKHGKATGTDYEQGVMDHGYRLIHQVRALERPHSQAESVCLCGAGDEPCPGQDGIPLCCDR